MRIINYSCFNYKDLKLSSYMKTTTIKTHKDNFHFPPERHQTKAAVCDLKHPCFILQISHKVCFFLSLFAENPHNSGANYKINHFDLNFLQKHVYMLHTGCIILWCCPTPAPLLLRLQSFPFSLIYNKRYTKSGFT